MFSVLYKYYMYCIILYFEEVKNMMQSKLNEFIKYKIKKLNVAFLMQSGYFFIYIIIYMKILYIFI